LLNDAESVLMFRVPLVIYSRRLCYGHLLLFI